MGSGQCTQSHMGFWSIARRDQAVASLRRYLTPSLVGRSGLDLMHEHTTHTQLTKTFRPLAPAPNPTLPAPLGLLLISPPGQNTRPLLVRRDALLVLDLGLHVVD
eukprot:7772149-Pyramimonas_sp.AAC.1